MLLINFLFYLSKKVKYNIFNFINMNDDENTNTFIHNIIEDFQSDLSGNPRLTLLNNLINVIQGNRLNENVSMLPLAGNIILPQQSQVRNILTQSLFQKNLYKNVLSKEGEKEIQKVKYNKENFDHHSCCISFDDFEENQEVYKLPCNHIFSESIFTWLKEESNKCPVCRHELSHKEIKNEDYLIDISNNISNRRVPVNPFNSFLDNMRNVYNNPRPITRQNASDNLMFHGISNPFSMRSVIDDFEYDRQYQNAILASIQEFENIPQEEEEEEEPVEFEQLDLWEDMILENISSEDDDDPMNQVD